MQSTTMMPQSSVAEPVKLANVQLVIMRVSKSHPRQHTVRMNITLSTLIAVPKKKKENGNLKNVLM